jgi:large subunit ribosomal protein L25
LIFKIEFMTIKAQKRTIEGKKVKLLRNEGIVPASIYGPKRESTSLQLNKKDFIKLFKEVGFNNFIELEIEGEQKKSRVLVKEIQKQPLSDLLLSVSFYQIDDETKVTVAVPIELVGESPAVKMSLGFLMSVTSEVEVFCLPKDLPTVLEVDISKLENPGDSITVSDLELPKGVEFSSSVEESTTIVSIAAPQKEEVEEDVSTDEESDGDESESGDESAVQE